MINWVAIVTMPVAIAIGAEIGRRRAEKRGKLRSMLAPNEHRVFALLGGLGAALCVETGSLALSEPTTQHVWYLIASVTFAFAAFATHMVREQNLLRRAYDRLNESDGTS